MNIKIEKLKEGDSTLVFYADEITGLIIDEFNILSADDLNLSIQKNGNYLHIQGNNTVKYEAVCDRCAEDYRTEVIVKIDYFFHIGEMNTSDPGDIEIIDLNENGGNLLFDDFYIESFLLAQPLRSLCKESCQGLCQQCGANLNNGKCGCEEKEHTDPRWEKLTELLNKK